MSLTAGEICRQIRLIPALRETIREHCLAIDDRLRRAPMALGANCLAHELPTRFTIPGLSREKAQTIVYSAILRSLINRKFDARILIEDHRTILYVRWFVELSAAEDNAMVALLKAYRIRPGEVDAFVAGDGGPSASGRPGAAKPFSLAGPARRPPQPRGGTAAPPPAAPAAPGRKGPSPAEVALLGDPRPAAP